MLELILAKNAARHAVIHWARRLGGPGLVLIGIGDSSVIPTFGSMDAMLILFAGNAPRDWPYYSLMALIGSIIGGYLTFRMGREGGKAALEKRFPKKKLERVYHWTQHHSFWAVSVPSFLPPPAPLSPFLLAAGAMNISRKKFLVAYSSARAGRYALIGWLGSKYGHTVLHWLKSSETPLLIILVVLGVCGTPVVIWYWKKKLKNKALETKREPKAA